MTTRTKTGPHFPQAGLTCAVGGCDTAAVSRGWCSRHYQHARHHDGDPGPAARHRASGDEVSYAAVHARIKRSLGPAAAFDCVDCGDPARDWSYIGGDPDERVGEHGGYRLTYSLNPSRYAPRCRRCHYQHDHKGD